MKKLIILLPLLLCACTKAPEINDLMIISGISVDLTDDGYEVCSEITDVHTSDINEIKPVFLKTRGKSVAEAISEEAAKAVPADITLSMSDSFGFGGHNACVAFRKV